MTLTRILPTLRRSIPDPITADQWPEGTAATITDVTVAGISLLRLADLCGTPAVQIRRAVTPGTGGSVAAPTGSTGVVVVRVLDASAVRNHRVIAIDADLCALDPVWAETRLMGRASVARVASFTVVAEASGCPAPMPVDLPSDLTAGDLLALPYADVTEDAGFARPASGWRAYAGAGRAFEMDIPRRTITD